MPPRCAATQQQARRDRIQGVWKSAKRAARKLRHRAAVGVHRALHVTGCAAATAGGRDRDGM